QMKTQRAPSLRSGFRLRAPATLTPARRLSLDLSSLALLDRTALGMTDQNPKGSLAALGISAAGSRYAHARKTPQPRLVLTRYVRSDGARDDGARDDRIGEHFPAIGPNDQQPTTNYYFLYCTISKTFPSLSWGIITKP